MTIDGPLMVGVISAGAALAGVALSQAISLRQAGLAARKAKADLLREKLEALALALTASLDWEDSATTTLGSGEPQPAGSPLPARRVYALAQLYFPTLKDRAERYRIATAEMYFELDRPVRDGDALRECVGRMVLARKELDDGIAAIAEQLQLEA